MDWFIWLSKTGLEASLVYEYGLAFGNNELEEEDIAYFNHEFLQSMGISIAKHRLEILKLARKDPKSHHNNNNNNNNNILLKHYPTISKLVLVLKNTKKSLKNYIANWVHPRDEDRGGALILVSNTNKKNKMMTMRRSNNNNSRMRMNKGKGGGGGGAISYSSRWRRAMMMKNNNRKLVMMNNATNSNNNEERLMITNGDYLGDYLGEDDDDDHHHHMDMVVSTPKLHTFSSPLMYDLHQTKEEKQPHDDDQEVDAAADDDDQYRSPALEEIRWDAMFQDLKPT